MAEMVIRVENLGKRYLLGQQSASVGRYVALRDVIAQGARTAARRLLSGGGREEEGRQEEFWALKDVCFEVEKGQAVGIVGRNGAGKSTLLKVLSRITEPTTGRITLRGRVASLLEVGTGFHPELTGRENIFLNGAILGMSRAEIRAKFDDIVAFAEVERFLDTPVKRYSSGMYVRLAFAVAAHLEPEILVVDEVLAVGDIAFQKKCLGKMGDVATKEGRTVLFVSHDMRAIRTFCRSAIYMRQGRAAYIGSVEEAISLYSSDVRETTVAFPLEVDDLVVHGYEVAQCGSATMLIDGTNPFTINLEFELKRPLTAFRIGVYLRNSLGDCLFRAFLADWDPTRETLEAGRYGAQLNVPEKLLAEGTYTLLLHASRYGIRDYLTPYNIQHTLTVTAPSDFNLAHTGEPIGAQILLDRAWTIAPGENHP